MSGLTLPALVWGWSQPGEGTLRGLCGAEPGTLAPGQWLMVLPLSERAEGTVTCPWPGLSPHPPHIPDRGEQPHVSENKWTPGNSGEVPLPAAQKRGTAQLWPCPPHVSHLLSGTAGRGTCFSRIPQLPPCQCPPQAQRHQHRHHCFLAGHSIPGSFLKMSSLQLLTCFLKNC